MKVAICFFIFITTICTAQVKFGTWRGVLILNANEKIELPFNFEIKNLNGNRQIIIQNSLEKIVVDEITLKQDSLNFKMPVFDSEFKTKLVGDSTLIGVWINHARTQNNVINFSAKYGNPKRFDLPQSISNPFYDGKWEVTFSPNQVDSSKAIGVFKCENASSLLIGTFLTETGDYRYLDGMVNDGKLYLSCFDGSHAFLFIAENNKSDIINGHFYSGSHWHENWQAKRNSAFSLTDAEHLTALVTPNEKIDFSFFNLEKKKISISDKRYKNKPVIIQIMGSWCPNCMDETAYLANIYNRYNPKGLEIISICYERTADFEKAKVNLLRLKNRYKLKHELLISGLTGKESAGKSLPFLNKVMAFPTTIVLDKNHEVKMIHTGFSGPATGLEFENFKQRFEKVMNQITK